MKKIFVLTIAIALLLFPIKATFATVKKITSTSKLQANFSFSGRGYGHGVGMTQYGAEGMAEKGYTDNYILKYYYTGVGITNKDTSNTNINVALKQNVANTNILCNNEYYISDSKTHLKLFTIPADSFINVKYQDGSYFISNSTTSEIQNTTASAIELSTTGSGVIMVKNKSYSGTINLSRSNTTTNNLDVVNNLNIEQYLRGVIPVEMYAGWKPEALKAQILASRTYAMKQISLHKTRKFDVYDTVLSQVYMGESANDYRVDKLIADTQGEVITYKGKLIDALFSASAGGYTVDASFVWGTAVPYLKGKPDPYDKSVYATNWWTYTIKRTVLQKLFTKVGNIYKIQVSSKKFLRPTFIKITGSKTTITISAPTFRNKLNYSNIASALFSI